MSNEATVRCGLTISGPGPQRYDARPSSFRADISLKGGPSPGSFTVTEEGTDVDLSALFHPSLCRIMNLEDPETTGTRTVTVGRWDPDTDLFYPFMDVLPGESYVIRLAEQVSDEFSGTGTGTTATVSTLRIKAKGSMPGYTEQAQAVVLVEAFER